MLLFYSPEATMKSHRLLSLRVAVFMIIFASLHAGTLIASSGGHKYFDNKSGEIIARGLIYLFDAARRHRDDDDSWDCLHVKSNLISSATFMQEYGRELPGLFVPEARYVTCRPAGASARPNTYALVTRLTNSTNALQAAVTFNHNLVGWIESLTFDRPVTLAAGTTYPAGTPVPIEPLMRALALRRTAFPPSPQTLTIKRAVQKTSYANRDIAKAKVSSLLRGSVPTTLEGFNWVGHFYITPLPLLTTDDFVHVIERMYEGTKRGKHPKYTHLFVYSNATEKTPPFGLFMATLRKGNLDFIYKFKLDNRDTNLVAAPEFEAVRAFLATNPPLRGLDFARFFFAVDDATHSASNVPMLGRITKGSSSLGNVKPRPAN
jgi:hypothetical protein